MSDDIIANQEYARSEQCDLIGSPTYLLII